MKLETHESTEKNGIGFLKSKSEISLKFAIFVIDLHELFCRNDFEELKLSRK